MVYTNHVKYVSLIRYGLHAPWRALTSYTSDILSFYKEELEGDDRNVVHCRAKWSGKDVHNILKDIVDEVTEAIASSRSFLSGKEREAAEAYMSGYISFHYLAPRYRMDEIIGT